MSRRIKEKGVTTTGSPFNVTRVNHAFFSASMRDNSREVPMEEIKEAIIHLLMADP